MDFTVYYAQDRTDSCDLTSDHLARVSEASGPREAVRVYSRGWTLEDGMVFVVTDDGGDWQGRAHVFRVEDGRLKRKLAGKRS